MVTTRHRAISMSFNGNLSENEMQKSLKSMAELKSIYKDLRYDWPQLVQGDTTPLEMAVAFLDDTSVGLAHRKEEFDGLCTETGRSLKTAVVESHETFNNSIGSYHQLISIARESQLDSDDIKRLIDNSTSDMRDRSAILKDLDSSSAKYAEMIEVLDAMEYLRDIPTQIDSLISEKKIHQVYDVIADGYKTAATYNLWTLSSMDSTKRYLEQQSNNLYDMIVDELSNEIYLKHISGSKGPWSNMIHSNTPQISSFKTLISQSTTLESFIYNSANLDFTEIALSLTEDVQKFLEQQLPKLTVHFSNTNKQKRNYFLLLESTSNPSTESYFYIYMLLHTASKLNKLQPVIDILLNSMQSELQSIINQTTEECKSLNLHRLARIAKARSLESDLAQDKIGGQSFSDSAVPVLQDFFGSFFLKCLVILSKHKITCEIVKQIRSSENISTTFHRNSALEVSSLTYDFQTVWNIISKEITSLLINYIANDKRESSVPKLEMQSNRIHQVLAQKQLFKLDDAKLAITQETSEELKAVFDDMFPGFQVKTQKFSKQGGETNSPYITKERFSSMVDTLVPKNIYNMRIIFDFFLIFVTGSHYLFVDFDRHSKVRTDPQVFFINVMKDSFLTRLSEEFTSAFNECMSSNTAIELNAESNKASVRFNQALIPLSDENCDVSAPGFKTGTQIYLNAMHFKSLLKSVCHTMNTSFTYREDISNLVLSLLKRFASIYEDYSREIITSGGSHDITDLNVGIRGDRIRNSSKIVKWLKAEALTEVSEALFHELQKHGEIDHLISKETDIMFYENEPFEVSKDDTMDDDSFNHICHLLSTTSWILSWLPSMRKESNFSAVRDTQTEAFNIDKLRQDYSILENGRASNTSSTKLHHVYLTLNSKTIHEFDIIVMTLEKIRGNALIALRYDIRIKALLHIGQSFKDDFVLTTEPSDADPFISSLNKEIYFVGTQVGEMLTGVEKTFIFSGLPYFLCTAFIRGSEILSVINNNGIKKILLNIYTSQQMLRSVMMSGETFDLSQASKYFEFFTSNEHSLVQNVATETSKYNKREVLNLVRLMYSEKLRNANASAFNKSKYNELVKRVSELFV